MERTVPIVLVVEDNEDARVIYDETLRYYGYHTELVGDGEEGVEAAARLLPDVILMDIELPRLSGIEATRRIKADPRTSDIPIIIVSAHALDDAHRRAREVGCDAFLRKPTLPLELLHQVELALSA